PGTASGELVINDNSEDFDFRVESDANANGLFYDASTQNLSINGTYLGSDVGFCVNGISTDSIACLELNGDRSTNSTVNAIRMYCAGTEVGTIDTLRDGADNNAAMRFFTGNSGTLTEGFKLTASGQPIFAVARNDTTSDAANMNIRSSDGLVRRSTSSRRYKNTITDATHGLTELLTLRPVTYKGNNDGDRLFGGLIAEEVHEAGLTEFVQYNGDDEPDALAYGHMVSLCIKAIQQQQELIGTLQTKVAALEGGS
ncbi:MAG: tail fiber domain-containing protein, partial [Pseudomonadota bacterium]|nr:tail fiber domain-containing protein [Pseudomonadota bacterium]